MAIPVIMPRQGQSVETCIITRWFRSKGERVNAGDLLFSYETDKAAFDAESPADGVLLEVFYEEGAEVPVLVNVAVIGVPGEEVAGFGSAGPMTEKEKDPDKGAASAVDPVQQEPIAQAPEPCEPSEGVRVKISPRARIMANTKGLDIRTISGTGPNGRIISSDIERALAASPAASFRESPGKEFSDQPLSGVRRLIAKAMHQSLQNSAQLTHHMSADARRLLDARKKIKASLAAKEPGARDITLNDMICWCVIRALKKFPELNAHFLDDTIRTFSSVNLGLAVDTPRGLMVPAVKNTGSMNIDQLSVELRKAADAARKGNIDPDLLKGSAASFTVSNLGNYGVEMFTPVINLPQVAILGVCTIINRPVSLDNNTFAFVPYIGLSLTYDHRAVDGGPATLFLKEVCEEIEKGVRREA